MQKEKTMNPVPKSLQTENRTGYIFSSIKYELCFAKAADVFCGYAESKFGVKFSYGDGGIELLYDETLEKEEYAIRCNSGSVVIAAATHKGMSNALACLLSLLSLEGEGFKFECCYIKDKPDAFFRTFMLDTARYIHEINYLYKYIDLCYMNRLSFFQLHLTDDQNFSFVIPEYPKLNGKYTKEMLTSLAEYAEDRGITIIPEIDVPGHTYILTSNYPEIFGQCGVLSASEKTFSALERIFAYVHEIFPNSPYIHIGGDEANIAEWEKCEASQAYMKQHNISSVKELYAVYIRRATEIIFSLGCIPIVWEGFAEEYNDYISKDVIVVVWESLYQTADRLVKSGFKVINASWEPLYIVTRGRYWTPAEILKWNIRTWRNWLEKSAAYPNGITLAEDEGEVLGGQLCAWGNGFCNCDNCEALCEEELKLVEERIPAFAERTWNAYKR
jgi:hexosaminidase